MKQQYRDGDVVLVRGTVETDKWRIRERVIFDKYVDLPIANLDIVKVERTNFQVGDRVLDEHQETLGTIVALTPEEIEPRQAWVQWDGRPDLATELQNRIAWVPPEEPADEAEAA